MTPVFPAQRRAEQFDALIEGTSTNTTDSARFADLLELVAAVRSVPQAQPRPEFVSSLRERLMAEATTVLADAPTTDPALEERLTVAPRRTARERRFATAIGGVAIVGATTSMAMAAQSAMPGDVLYPIKRAIENGQAALDGEDARGSTLLAHASSRLAEVGVLSQAGPPDNTAEVSATLVTFAEQATEASDLLLLDYQSNGDEAAIEELRDFTAVSLDELAALEAQVPEGAREALLAAAQVLFTIDQAAQQACPTCAGTGITDLPAALLDPVSAVSSAVQVPQRLDDVQPGITIKKSKGKSDDELLPAPGEVRQPHVVEQPPRQDDGGGSQQEPSTGGGGGNPVTDLTEGLTGGLGNSGGGGTESGVSGPKIPEILEETGGAVGDTVEETLDDLLDP